MVLDLLFLNLYLQQYCNAVMDHKIIVIVRKLEYRDFLMYLLANKLHLFIIQKLTGELIIFSLNETKRK